MDVEDGHYNPRAGNLPREVDPSLGRPDYGRTISGSSTGSMSDPLPAVPDSFNSPTILPPMYLPPAVTSSPIVSATTMDKLPSRPIGPNSARAKLVRPRILRRAVSDYNDRSQQLAEGPHAIPLNRSMSDMTDAGKSIKRSPQSADLISPTTPDSDSHPDYIRVSKSPRRSPTAPSSGRFTSNSSDQVQTPAPQSSTPTVRAGSGGLGLVDEGDVRPSADATDDMALDVTFDDEGLSTLERIFLLSKSDYPFHRAYVARVLGDLLLDVDPCESVEYVLPLVSGFTIDEEEAVKEALASELHRILWYFFSTCRVYVEGEDDPDQMATELDTNLGPRPPSQAQNSIPTPPKRGSTSASTSTTGRKPSVEDAEPRRPSLADTLVGSSLGSNLRLATTSLLGGEEVDTPGTQVSDSAASDSTAFSQVDFTDPFSKDKADGEMTVDVGPLQFLPPLPANFFTPLLGALLLNSNPTISEMCRSCVIKIIARLRGKSPAIPVEWGAQEKDQHGSEQRTFASQVGPHSHIIQELDPRVRNVVETELMRGIVIGMGSLDTEMPEDLLPTLNEEMTQDERDAAALEVEVFKDQLVAEALAGRATSMNLIGALCEFYSGEEAVERGFAEEIIRSPDGDPTVRAEAAVALQAFATIAPADQIGRLVSLFAIPDDTRLLLG